MLSKSFPIRPNYAHCHRYFALTSGREGFLATDGEDFAKRIAQICQDSQLRARLQANTRATAARFSWPKVIEQHLHVYELAIERAAKKNSSRAELHFVPPSAQSSASGRFEA